MLIGNKLSGGEWLPIHNEFRDLHTFVIGKTGTGKSTAFKRWMIEDIERGAGLCFVDVHGWDAVDLLRHIPKKRLRDVVFFNAGDLEHPFGFNLLANVPPHRRSAIATSVVEVIKITSRYADLPTPQMDEMIFQSVMALLHMPNATLLGIKHMLTSKNSRKEVVSRVTNPAVRDFWKNDFGALLKQTKPDPRQSTLNKVRMFNADTTLANILGQPDGKLDMKDIIDNQKILIVVLPLGQLGTSKVCLLGALILAKIHSVALDRIDPLDLIDHDVEPPTPFYLYLDEAHYLGNEILIEMLSGVRKFGISLVLSAQFTTQFPQHVREAVLGNVGTIVAFRTGANDARLLEPEFELYRDDYKMQQLYMHTANVRLPDRTEFVVMPELDAPERPSSPAKIRDYARRTYAERRDVVERHIARFIYSVSEVDTVAQRTVASRERMRQKGR